MFLEKLSVLRGGAYLALLVAGLAGCEPIGLSDSPIPEPRPAPPPSSTPEPSEESMAIARHFARVEKELLTQGLLRTDDGGPDIRFTTRDLVENFTKIALYDEYVFNGGQLIARESPSALRRWEKPVRFSLIQGDSLSSEQRAADRRNITRYVTRLSRISGHPISLTDTRANFHILILNEDERKDYAPTLQRLVPGLSNRDVNSVLSMPRSTLCHVYAFSGAAGAHSYDTAIAVIRAEHPDLMRLSCIHEELAQGLGLANDSRDARPSIFNDDEEFGLLTGHDELLLKMLYDKRLHPGMTPETARPTVEIIAAELRGPTS